jgi:hypothetical protein
MDFRVICKLITKYKYLIGLIFFHTMHICLVIFLQAREDYTREDYTREDYTREDYTRATMDLKQLQLYICYWPVKR